MLALKVFAYTDPRPCQAKFLKHRRKKKLYLSKVTGNDDGIERNDVIKDNNLKESSDSTIKLKKINLLENGTTTTDKLNYTYSDPIVIQQTSENMTEVLLNFLKNVGVKKNKIIDIGSLTWITNFFRNVSTVLQQRNKQN